MPARMNSSAEDRNPASSRSSPALPKNAAPRPTRRSPRPGAGASSPSFAKSVILVSEAYPVPSVMQLLIRLPGAGATSSVRTLLFRLRRHPRGILRSAIPLRMAIVLLLLFGCAPFRPARHPKCSNQAGGRWGHVFGARGCDESVRGPRSFAGPIGSCTIRNVRVSGESSDGRSPNRPYQHFRAAQGVRRQAYGWGTVLSRYRVRSGGTREEALPDPGLEGNRGHLPHRYP